MENLFLSEDSQPFNETSNNHQQTDDIHLSDRILIEPSAKHIDLFNEKPYIHKASNTDAQEEDTIPDYNTRALVKHATTYELEKFKKNVLLIFNQENIEGYSPRLGTEKDVEALQRAFQKIGFSVVEYKDLIMEEIFIELNKFRMKNFSDYGCLAIAVLTHGSRGKLMAKTGSYYSENILNVFNVRDNPTLVTKPRLLLIQACRNWDNIHERPDEPAAKVQKYSEVGDEHYYLPEESDLLILESSYIGKVAFRSEIEGSWFIQSFCNKIEEMGDTHDLEAIAIEMKKEVAIEKENAVYNIISDTMEFQKQMPVMTSTLIRKLHLKKYGDNSSVAPAKMPSTSDVLCRSIADEPLQIQFGVCSCNLDHIKHIRNSLRLMTWMSATETLLKLADCSEAAIQTLETELKEYALVLDSMKLLEPQLCQPTTADGDMAYSDDIMKCYEDRFASISERLQRLKKNVERGSELQL